MTGARLTWRWEDADLDRWTRDRLRDWGNAGPILRALGMDQAERVRDRFVDQTGPGREPWTPLSPVTIAKRSKAGTWPGRILSARGRLSDSINFNADAASFTVGTDGAVDVYAGIHQFGGQAGRGGKVTIPARPYLGFDEEDVSILEEELLDYLAGNSA